MRLRKLKNSTPDKTCLSKAIEFAGEVEAFVEYMVFVNRIDTQIQRYPCVVTSVDMETGYCHYKLKGVKQSPVNINCILIKVP